MLPSSTAEFWYTPLTTLQLPLSTSHDGAPALKLSRNAGSPYSLVASSRSNLAVV
jgi:hypothetical protein